jgi:type IX secretion system PorP/SprF family membrane protein
MKNIQILPTFIQPGFKKTRLKGGLSRGRLRPFKKLLTTLLVFCNLFALAQQDPLFSHYMFNKLLVNPAYAGSKELFAVELLDRYQWVGIDGAPKTIALSAHAALRSQKVGLGGFIFRDVIGPTINQGFMATYAYRIRTQNGWFSMGLQGGIKYFDLDWNMINSKYPDYVFYPQDIKKITPDLDLGFYYQTTRFFAGLSSKHLLGNEYGWGEVEGKSSYSILARHFYVMSGFAVPLNDKMVFRPSAMLKYVQNNPVQLDINASILFNDIFWLGISYRTEKAVVFLTEFWITNNIRLGYSFDMYFNNLQLNNNGSHEIRFGFDIVRNKSKMKTPRYF